MTKKQVRFSQNTNVYGYIFDSEYESEKCYTSEDIEDFRRDAEFDAHRIRSTIATYPKESSDAVDYLLRRNMLNLQDFVGNEEAVAKEIKKKKKSSFSFFGCAQTSIVRERLSLRSSRVAVAEQDDGMAVVQKIKSIEEKRASLKNSRCQRHLRA